MRDTDWDVAILHAEIEQLRSKASKTPSALRAQVREFQAGFGVSQPDAPTIPEADRVRVRLRLVSEEFFELLASCIDGRWLRHLERSVREAIDTAPVDVDIVGVADALADIDYVNEGMRLEFGLDGGPVANEVHRSNMSKIGGPVVGGKIQKGSNYSPPDLVAVLRAQGWQR